MGTLVIHCMTLNVNGLLNSLKRWRLVKFIIKEHINVVCLQETHLKELEFRYLKEVFSHTIYHAASSGRSRGIMLGISRRIPWELKEQVMDQKGRYIVLRVVLNQADITIVGIYALNTEQVSFWGELYAQLNSKIRGELLILGDFNMVIE